MHFACVLNGIHNVHKYVGRKWLCLHIENEILRRVMILLEEQSEMYLHKQDRIPVVIEGTQI